MQTLLPITLGIARPLKEGRASSVAKPYISKAPDPSSDDYKKAWEEKQDSILKRDDYTCRYCGFRAERFQQVVHTDHDKKNWDDDNLVTACIFCHQCFVLEDVGPMESGFLVWMPELEQYQISHLARSLYIARVQTGAIKETAEKVYKEILARQEDVKKRLKIEKPEYLATVLRDYLGPQAYQDRAKKLDGVRLFPRDKRQVEDSAVRFNQFPSIIAYWRKKTGPYGGDKSPQNWLDLHQKLSA